MNDADNSAANNFIRHIVEADIASGKHGGKVATRFPPEPNGYLHIGHAKSICLNFGIAADYSGTCNLRFDDTNPHKENIEYIESIKTDVRWLGFDWQDRMYFASDYFERLYEFAVELIRSGKAYVCDQSPEEMRKYRGTLTEPGRNSPWRERSVDENIDLFARMRAGDFADGTRVLRARIDMGSPNINMRDPALYRIRHGVIHHQTGEEWCIYPMYDYTHPISDALEGITHSLCTLEFADHRPLYDWVLDNISVPCHPQQIEFSRLNLVYSVMSKRKLTELVNEGRVDGWDDPRMPTIAGLRRRGYTPASIRDFCSRIGISKSENTVEMGVLENSIREDLNIQAYRRMVVLKPLKVILVDYPAEETEMLEIANHPQDAAAGSRVVHFSKELYIDRSDFMEDPPKGFKRLVPGGEVRLRHAYVIRCDEIVRDSKGEIIELHCSHGAETLGANPEGCKVKGVIHWVSARYGIPVNVRLYERLFMHPSPDAGKEGKDYREYLNPDSLESLTGCMAEPALAEAVPGTGYQFEREGYFCRDSASRPDEPPLFNRTVTLRDSWAKIEQGRTGK